MEIVKSIRRILRKAAEHSRDLGRAFGLSAPQVLCLRAIAESDSVAVETSGATAPRGNRRVKGRVADAAPPSTGPMTVARLADSVHMPIATVSRILDRLEQAGYVERRRSAEDRRRVQVILTRAGRQKLSLIPTPLHEKVVTKLRQLDRQSQETLLDGLRRVVELMDAADLDVAPVITPEVDVASQVNGRGPAP